MMLFYAPVYFLARRTCSFLASEGQQVAALMILCMAILFGGLFIPIYVMGRNSAAGFSVTPLPEGAAPGR